MITNIDILIRLENWYLSQCDGNWEHEYGIEINTLDNPGWLVTIDLVGTSLETRGFTEIDIGNEEDWIQCNVKNSQFCGAGSANNLTKILEVFVQWAEK